MEENEIAINSQELMKRLSLSRGKLMEMISNNEIPYFKIGTDYRFYFSEVMAKLNNKKIRK